jgi:hypothetical protein
MGSFTLGLVAGGLLTLLILMLLLRLSSRSVRVPTNVSQPGLPDLTLSLSRDLLHRLVVDGLRDVSLPLVTLRDPYVQLEPDAVLVVRLRGDTILLGGQMIVLRMRLVPAATSVRIVTQTADVGRLGNIAGPLTALLDQRLNLELAQRLAFASQFEILAVHGTTDEIMISARLKA